MTNKHTDLPWRVCASDSGVAITVRSRHDIVYQEFSSDQDAPDSRQNHDAHLIVTACNYHHRLREALQDLDEAFCLRHGCFPLDEVTEEQKTYKAAMTKARALLAELDNLEQTK